MRRGGSGKGNSTCQGPRTWGEGGLDFHKDKTTGVAEDFHPSFPSFPS